MISKKQIINTFKADARLILEYGNTVFRNYSLILKYFGILILEYTRLIFEYGNTVLRIPNGTAKHKHESINKLQTN